MTERKYLRTITRPRGKEREANTTRNEGNPSAPQQSREGVWLQCWLEIHSSEVLLDVRDPVR